MAKMGRRPNLLNVRQHLEFGELLVGLLGKYGDCPLVREGFNQWALVNRAIMRKHDEQRAEGNRKDIRLADRQLAQHLGLME